MGKTTESRRVLVMGTDHAVQRHQDTMPERAVPRAAFERRLREAIVEGNVTLIAEEAGDDTEVWEHLRRDDEVWANYAALFGGGRTVDSPVPTIARTIANERPDELRYVDIRATNASEMSIAERDEAMVTRVIQVLGSAESVLVIVGEDHRNGVAEMLRSQGLAVQSLRCIGGPSQE